MFPVSEFTRIFEEHKYNGDHQFDRVMRHPQQRLQNAFAVNVNVREIVIVAIKQPLVVVASFIEEFIK